MVAETEKVILLRRFIVASFVENNLVKPEVGNIRSFIENKETLGLRQSVVCRGQKVRITKV